MPIFPGELWQHVGYNNPKRIQLLLKLLKFFAKFAMQNPNELLSSLKETIGLCSLK